MNLKEWVIFAYGVIFATSTPYLKPKKRFLFPTATWKFDEALTFFLGGSGICARLKSDVETFLVNVNIDVAADQWREDLAALGGAPNAILALNSLSGFYGRAEEIAAFVPTRVYAHADVMSEDMMSFENVTTEKVLKIGEETVRLIPVTGCATETDLVVLFEKRSLMMFGSLFNNRIHPVLKMGVAHRASHWIATLENLLAKYQPGVCVPGEGEFGDADDVREFIRYLQALTDPSVEFSFCRQNFDWMEIPRFTSLDENFDILRRNVKTHASIN